VVDAVAIVASNRVRVAAALTTIAAFILLACGGSAPSPTIAPQARSQSPPSIEPTQGDLTDILEAEPQVVAITSTSARATVTTTVDVAFAVAFGTTTEYGRLAVDSDMGGTGHSEHGPLLTGLEPDTEYHLTFGGIGPDGTVYG